MMFYGMVFAIMGIVSLIACLGFLSENKGHSAGTAILIALVCGGVAMNHFETRSELKAANKQVYVINAANKQLVNEKAFLDRKLGQVNDELAETQVSLKEAVGAAEKSQHALVEVKGNLQIATNEVVLLTAELKAAKDTTQVDRDRMLLLEQENTELRTTLADIQEAVR